jgi:hypothetical protein
MTFIPVILMCCLLGIGEEMDRKEQEMKQKE